MEVEREIGKQSRNIFASYAAHGTVSRIRHAKVVPEDGPATPEYANSLSSDCSGHRTIENRAQHGGEDDNVERIGFERKRIAVAARDSNIRVTRASQGDSFGQQIDPLKPIGARPIRNETGESVTIAAADVKDSAVAQRKELMAFEQLFEHGRAFALHGCNAGVAWVPASGVPRSFVVGIDTGDAPRFALGSLGRSVRSVWATQTHVMSSIRWSATRAHWAVWSSTTI